MAETPSSKRLFWAGLLLGGLLVGVATQVDLQAGAEERERNTHEAAVRKEPSSSDDAELREDLVAQLEAERARTSALRSEVDELRAELNREQRERIDRELEFLNLNEVVASMELDAPKMQFAKELLAEKPGAVIEEPDKPALDPELVARQRRSEEMLRDLRALMHAEWVQGLDLLELGQLSDEGWIGPVIFRLVDDRNRMTGNLIAARLRMQGSRSGRVITILLEESEERRGGEAVPYPNSTRRLYLPGIDPKPWIEALPELFSKEAIEPKDDGLWNLGRVRSALNERLSEDATGDVFNLRHLGGVKDGVLRDVHFAVRDRNGAMLRHIFADRCLLLQREKGIQITLEDGVTMRGESRSPFLEGRYRIFLPSARVDLWKQSRLPGLVDGFPEAAVDEEASDEEPASSSGDSGVGVDSDGR